MIVSISQYAELCNVSFVTVQNWEKAGDIKYTYGKEKNVLGQPVKRIDVKKYPPRAAKKRGRKAPVFNIIDKSK